MPNILMPALSPTMEEGKIAKWLKNVGDMVKSGDVIAEIETDKATMEVEAVDEGPLSAILIPAGTENVKVNTPIAVIGEADAVKPAAITPSPAARRASTSPARGEVKVTTSPLAGEVGASPGDATRVGVAAEGFTTSASPITAIGVLTLTFSVPAGMRMADSGPSSTASTSMVALSVSISAMTSPDFTMSPTFLSHLAILPSSMVGDSAGMRILGIVFLSLSSSCCRPMAAGRMARAGQVEMKWHRKVGPKQFPDR